MVDKNVNPRWEELLVDLTPCGGPDGKLKIMVFDFDGNGLHDYIGEVDATVKDISMEVLFSLSLFLPLSKPTSLSLS